MDEKKWKIVALPEKVVWDSHNYVTLAVDGADCLHLSGNMHCVPLKYFRMAKPMDVDSFERAPMIGTQEDKCTYPRFFPGAKGELIFMYRDGRSGNGEQIFNAYDTSAKVWRRLLDKPLTSGQGKMNAYFAGPERGPDGRFHLCWVWRNTPDCATNHDISYARSADLEHWETVAGAALTLPITVGGPEIVDPVPPGGGAINGGVRFGFDSKNRVVIAYHKFDEAGKTQLYATRFEDGAWKSRQLSRWDYRWEFSGGGSIVFEINVAAPRMRGAGRMECAYNHAQYGAGKFVLDEETLAVLETVADAPSPTKEKTEEADPQGLQARQAADVGVSPESDTRYELRWETLGANRDKPRPEPWPKPTMLRVVKYGK